MHDCKYGNVIPKTNAEFWKKKRLGNVARDTLNIAQLESDGWKVLIVWECWTRNIEQLKNEILNFLIN
jgi:DNA mismatch endonuclease (patch repair protein)